MLEMVEPRYENLSTTLRVVPLMEMVGGAGEPCERATGLAKADLQAELRAGFGEGAAQGLELSFTVGYNSGIICVQEFTNEDTSDFSPGTETRKVEELS